MNDSYHTIGATKDRAQQAHREVVRNEQLERIADALEQLVLISGPIANSLAEPRLAVRSRTHAEIMGAHELGNEFEENGLSDVAEYLRANGAVATRLWIEEVIANAAANDDPEGWRLGNLETARDRLQGLTRTLVEPFDRADEPEND